MEFDFEKYKLNDYYYKTIYRFNGNKCISIYEITKYGNKNIKNDKMYYNELNRFDNFKNVEVDENIIVKYNRKNFEKITFYKIVKKLEKEGAEYQLHSQKNVVF